MKFEILYKFYGNEPKTQTIEADTEERARQAFLKTKPGVLETQIVSVKSAPKPITPISWVHVTTGKSVAVYEILPFLQIGSKRATSTRDLLSRLGLEDSDGNRRELRHAVDYYLWKNGSLICVSTDGYYIAGSKADVYASAAEKEKKAENLLNTAKKLRDLAASLPEADTEVA